MLQYQEEMAHVMKLYDYINDHGNHLMLMAIDEPPTVFESPLGYVTAYINELLDLVIEERGNAF